MRLCVETRDRARARDYRFLGDGPSEPWWRDAVGDMTDFEHPSLVVLSDEERRWRLFASGIPSRRRDITGSPIRCSLEAEGACGANDAAAVRNLAGAWLDLLDSPDTLLSRSLDELLTEGFISAAYRTDDAAVRASVGERLGRVVAGLPAHGASGPSEYGRWFAGWASATARDALVARCGELVGGTSEGVACLVNAWTADEVGQAPEEVGAILVRDGPRSPEALTASDEVVVSAGKAPRRPSDPPQNRSFVLAAVTMTTLLLVVLVLLLR